jgi:glycosyltransferase involved in cell wall biosynthesis
MQAGGKSEMLVLDIWSHIEPRFGGVGPAASSLATAVERCSGNRGHQIAICEHFEEKRADGIDPRVQKIDNPPIRGWADLQLTKTLRHAVTAADICHVHGLWVPHSLAVRRLADQLKKPLVSSVHGMLEIWEMNNKRLKKSLYSRLLERPSLARSLCLRALSEREVGDYRRFGARRPIAVVPNGINAIERVNTSDFLEEFPELAGKSIILFLGRVHHKKGILNLLQAWQSVARHHSDAHLVIAGPEYVGTLTRARQIIAELNLERTVTIMGVISGHTKLAALSAARYFCLPSYSEGFSVAVLEALSIGLPTVVTSECNIPSVSTSGAGVSTSNDPAVLAETLISCLSVSSREWQDMSLAARRLARSEFDWNVTGKTMNSVYEWLLGGNRPSCIVA